MFSSSSVFYIFLAVIAIIYTTPFIYTPITIYGAFKKKEQITFIKIILSANVLIIVNILYYFFSPNSLPYSSHTIFFITMSLITFLPASLSLLINLPKKVGIYTYIILFSLSLCVYNFYCFSEKLKQDHRAMVFSALEQGNIKNFNKYLMMNAQIIVSLLIIYTKWLRLKLILQNRLPLCWTVWLEAPKRNMSHFSL